jgi:oligopeptide/dipeptide ABC transporter ATP-binding protein
MLISHDISVINYATDRIVVMLNGRIMELGPTQDVIREPLHPYTKHLINIAKNGDATAAENSIEKNPDKCSFKSHCTSISETCANSIPGLLEVREGRFVACHNHKRPVTSSQEYSVPNLNVAI